MGQQCDGEGLSATERGSVGERGDGHSHTAEHRRLERREDLLGVREQVHAASVCGQSEEALERSSVEKTAAK